MSKPNNHDHNGNDIRRYMSPPPAPRPAIHHAAEAMPHVQQNELQQPPVAEIPRRRRLIITSSSSGEDVGEHAARGHHRDDPAPAQEPLLPVEISSSDDMYVLLNHESQKPAPNRRRASSEHSPAAYAAATPRRSQRARAIDNSPPNRVPRQSRQQRRTPISRRYQGEAEEDEDVEDDDSADESDQNAADLYRAAIMGVRNRPTAMMHVSIRMCNNNKPDGVTLIAELFYRRIEPAADESRKYAVPDMR